jgi:capsule polysaccharide export protein KpsE/RkpR
MIYPRIVNSLSFQLELLDKEIQFREYGVTTTWPDFLQNHYSRPLTSIVYNYTLGLPFTVLGGVRSLFSEDEDEVVIVSEDQLSEEYIEITQTQLEFIENLRDRINVSLDQETGLLNASVKLQDARAAAELNRFMIDLLKEYVTEYRVEKARSNVEFTERQKEEAQERFEEAQLALAEFQDRNISLSTARAQTELEQLQDEKDLAFNVYNSLSQRYEEARLELQEQTPVFSEVQAVNVPTRRSEPKRGQMMVIFTLLGGILAVGIVLVSPLINKFKTSFK